MRVIKQIVISVGALIFIPCGMQAIIIGSNTAVSVQGTALFPQSDTNNTALGFGSFAGGIVLENFLTTCTFSSQFPIGTVLALNGGTLELQRPLVCLPGLVVSTGGSLRGNSLNWQFTGEETAYLPGAPDLNLNFRASSNAGAVISSVDWSHDSQYFAVVTTAQLQIYSFNGTTATLAASTALAAAAFSVRWHPSAYYLAVGLTANAGNEVITYLFTPPSTLAVVSGANIAGNVTAVNWHPTGNWLAGGTTVSPQFLVWPATNGVLSAATGSIQANISNNALSWRPTYTYIALGTNTSPQLRVLSYNGTTIASNATFAIGQTVNAVDYSRTGSFIAVGLAGGTQTLQIYQHNPITGTLTQRYALTDSTVVNSVQWSADSLGLLVGRTAGAGLELTVYDWNPNTYSLTAEAIVNQASTVLSARFSPNTTYVAAAGASTANIAGIYTTSLTSTQQIFYLNNVNLELSGPLVVQQPMYIQGACSIQGYGNTVSLMGTGSLIISSGASLMLDNLTLTGLGTQSMQCVDNTGVVALVDSNLVMNQNYNFIRGSITVAGDVMVTGTNVFAYQSPQPLSINRNAALYFDSGSTFYYNPSSSANNLISMSDSTSQLYLYETALQLTTTGLRLTKGRVTVEGVCPVISSATQQSQGLQLGDGVSASNNIALYILPESSLAIQSGYVVYNNV